MDTNTERAGICLPGEKGGGGNQEFEAYPLPALRR